jgi:hypothetical protein
LLPACSLSCPPSLFRHQFSYPSTTTNYAPEDAAAAAKDTVGINAQKAKATADEVAGEAKGKTAELKGEAKGKAEEVKGEVKAKV